MKLRTQIAETAPIRCAGCYGQYPDRRHVDFEMGYDGPIFREGIAGEDGEVTNVQRIAIDELVLCEDCLRQAAALVGMVEDVELLGSLEAAETRRDELLEEKRGLEEHVKHLEAALASKKALVRQ